MGFFRIIKNNVIKWWQQVVLPILRIDNNNPYYGNLNVNSSLPDVNATQYPQNMQDAGAMQQNGAMAGQGVAPAADTGGSQGVAQVSGQEAGGTSDDSSDAQAVMERINREREEKRLNDLKKAEEQARLDAIMNANKVNINAFIKAGKDAIEQKQEEQKASADADAIARANEIMERLNREAAEDEAKKAAEIEEAKRKAQETFGN